MYGVIMGKSKPDEFQPYKTTWIHSFIYWNYEMKSSRSLGLSKSNCDFISVQTSF